MNTHRFLSTLRAVQVCLVIAAGAFSAANADTVAYWNFNSLTTATNNGTSYTPTSGAGALNLTGWTTAGTAGITAFAGTTINALNSDVAGQSLALQGGAGSGTTNNGKSLVLNFSLTGFQNPVLNFATQKTGTGFNSNQVAYSTDGTTYTNFGSPYTPPASFASQSIDFSSVSALNGAVSVFIKITFNGATATSGNNRIDNLLVTATPGAAPAATQVRLETAATGSGSLVASQSVSVGTAITAYSITRDDSNTFMANASATWSLTSVTGGVVAGDLVPAGDNKSAVFTPHAAGSAVIHATIGTLTSVDSGVITATSCAEKSKALLVR